MKIGKQLWIFLKKILPTRLYLDIRTWRRGIPGQEYNLKLLPYLCDKSKISIDIGASGGLYASHMLKYSKYCLWSAPQK